MVSFIKNHPYWSFGTAGLAVVGYLGYRAVRWVLEKTGIIKRVDAVGHEMLPRTLEVPRDGNCLFHSFIAAAGIKTDHMVLRNEVVDWLTAHKNDEHVFYTIRQAFNQEKEEKIKRHTDELLALRHSDIPDAPRIAKRVRKELRRLRNRPFDVDYYLRRMRRPSTFGNEPEILALSQLYPVRLKIWTEGSPRPLIYEQSDDPSLKELNVRLTGDHFNVELH